MPDGNGKDFFTSFKKSEGRFPPVIFLTVKNDDKSIIEGLDLGAEDYITKPFKLAVLYSKIKVVLRRVKNFEQQVTGRNDNSEIILQEYKLDIIQKRFFKSNIEIKLTQQEYNLLNIFFQNPNQTITRERLIEVIWDNNENFVEDNTLTATIRRLRKKIDADVLKTIHGIGYRFEV